MRSHRDRCGKRFLPVLSILLLLFAAFFLCSFSETEDYFRYTVEEDGSAVIVGYRGYDTSLTIPAKVDGIPVKAVSSTALYGNSIIRELTVSAGIGSIEKDAFAYCENLTRVTFEDGSCTFIGESAFEGCILLETLRLPDSLTEIDDFAFQGCLRLARVEIPTSLAKIGYRAFGDCESLVFDAENNAFARDYAKENNIDLSLRESSLFGWAMVALGVVVLLVAVFLVYRFIMRKRNKTAKEK